MANENPNRLSCIYVVEALMEISDLDTPVSINELKKVIDNKHGKDVISKKVIARELLFLIDEEIILGLRVEFSDDITEKVEEQKFNSTAKKFRMANFLEPEEATFIRDAIATYPYMDDVTTEKLIEKINKLVSEKYRKSYGSYNISAKKVKCSVIDAVGHIQRAIAEGGKIEFQYNSYDVNKTLQKSGEKRTELPLALLWANGYYYMVSYSDKYQSLFPDIAFLYSSIASCKGFQRLDILVSLRFSTTTL